MFGVEDGEIVVRKASEIFYNAPEDKPIEATQAMSDVIVQTVANKKQEAKTLLARHGEQLHAPLPKNYNELAKELDSMGYTTKDFFEFIKEKGYDYTNKRNWIMKGMMSQPAMNALLDLRQIQYEKANKLK